VDAEDGSIPDENSNRDSSTQIPHSTMISGVQKENERILKGILKFTKSSNNSTSDGFYYNKVLKEPIKVTVNLCE